MMLLNTAIKQISPVAISFGNISIYWYGIILGTAALVALLLAIREGKKHGLPSELFLDMMLIGVPAGIIGGRIYYVIFKWDYYSQFPADIIAVWKGGLAIHGVIVGMAFTILWFAFKRGISFWKLADVIAPHVLLAQAIGRWGNFINQEAHGSVVSREYLEGFRLPEFIINQMYIYNPSPGEGLVEGFYYHHPTFLYESLWNLLGFFILISLRRLKIFQGELLLGYLMWYSAGRFFIEGLRTDSLMVTDTLRAAQMVSLLLFLLAVAILIYRRLRVKEKRLYHEPDIVRLSKSKVNKPNQQSGKKSAKRHKKK
jgi:phosphatidylglycerol:prolipoprotein diacylglycerol transferase